MATKKDTRGGHAGTTTPERPKLRSSHEGVLRGGETKKAGKVTVSRAPREAREVRSAKNGAPGPRPRKAKPPMPPAPPQANVQASDEARALATAVATAALEKKAVALSVLDVAGKVDYADVLVIMTGRSDRHVAALAQTIEEALGKKGIHPLAVEGLSVGSWVLMDFGDVVVHVFQDEARATYDLDGLWMDARKLPVPIPEDLRE